MASCRATCLCPLAGSLRMCRTSLPLSPRCRPRGPPRRSERPPGQTVINIHAGFRVEVESELGGDPNDAIHITH
eukprot:15283040-Heterocapsa_arctica.AAC.2